MANYHDKVRGIIEGLSDFWLLYFKEIDQLQTLYQGTDILLGQSYLDLLSLLMNNSVQDAPLFNKEYFKLIQIKETEVKYVQGTNPANDRFVYIAEDNVVTAPFLNNKILSVTSSLERDVDYQVSNRKFEFIYDPLNAYLSRSFGTGNSVFKIRNRNPLITNIRISLMNDGTTPVTITRNDPNNDIVIAFGNTATTRDVVQVINLHPVYSGLLYAELELSDGGQSLPPDTGGFVDLLRTASNPLDGYATRSAMQMFGGKFTTTSIPSWVAAGVQKGDILRLVSGPTVGIPQEFVIDLVRDDALYVSADTEIASIKPSDKTEFKILREPQDNQVIKAPLAFSGQITGAGTADVLATTRELTTVSASFSPLHKGDIIELQGALNVGYARILSVANANTVVLSASTITDEAGLSYNLYSTYSTLLTDGVLTNNGDGTATFTAASAPFTTDAVGTAIRISRGGALETYAITSQASASSVTIPVATDVADGTGLTWGWASYIAPATTLAYPQVKAGSVTVNARRFVDESAVVEGRDYIVKEDTAQIQPLTTWRAAVDNTVDYAYRLLVVSNTTALQSGTDGTLTFATPSTFTSASAAFSYNDIGHAIRIENSGLMSGASNNQVFFIASIIDANNVTLTSAVASTADPNNGVLTWSMLPRGVWATQNITAFVSDMSLWAPDALVDRFHLYNTFGYLINRFEPSSEAYRALIRGIFQLFMLGPTLERFESAVNIVAGISVIRDDGEILIDYSTGATQSGSDGLLVNSTRTFTSASAVFTAEAESDFIYIKTGLNESKLYKIAYVVNAQQVVLDSDVVTDGPVEWELSTTGIQTVITSRRTYTFARNIPMRSTVTDSANIGTKIFLAFEVLTDVFTVTDYVETPTWWENIQIPAELWVGEDALRRQSTPALFENVIGANDDPRIGDPGLIIGGDSQGFVPPSVEVYNDGGLADGELIADVNYPFSNNVFFTTATNTLFTANDQGNYLIIGSERYRIIERLTASHIQIEAFVPVVNASGLAWSVESQPVPLRHKAAFVVLDTWLKYQMFSVTFNPVLLGQISGEFLSDLQELVFVAKPSYTYIALSPSSLFQEVIRVAEETLEVDAVFTLGGTAGEHIMGESPILKIGDPFRVGSWFRYVDFTSTLSIPAVSITDVLDTPDAGYEHYVTKFVPDYTDFTRASGSPIQTSTFIETSLLTGSANAEFILGAEFNSTITLPSAILSDAHIGATIRITGSISGNDGDHVIGRLISASIAVVGTPGGTSESGLDWELITTGSQQGAIRNTTQGECTFTDLAGVHLFQPADVGTYIRYVYTSNIANQGLRINSVPSVNSPTCKLAAVQRVHPLEDDPDETCAVAGNTFTDIDALFDPFMGRTNRAISVPTEELALQYFIVFTSGANSGERRRIETVVSAAEALLSGTALATDAAADYYIEVEKAYVVVQEASTWEHLKLSVLYDKNTIDLSNVSSQDTEAGVSFTAYGVREPIDPASETMVEADGDTYYAIGMVNPRLSQGRTRTSRDVDLKEDPIQITVT